VLDDLERQATANNQDLKAAVARVTQARALAATPRRTSSVAYARSISVTRADYGQRTQSHPESTRHDFRVPPT